MYVLSILIITILTTKTIIQANEYSLNVGTVLFSSADLHKPHWSKTDLSLLRIRRHFQELLPPPNFIDTTSEEYIYTLLKYIKDTYSSIKREAECPVSDNLMTTAFSDALGGYLKLWVLPITKLSFYGGTVSQDNLLKLYKFHDEIKRYLKTDGSAWRGPDKIILKTITVNVAPPRHITKRMKNPCQHLAYYEKTDNGLSIPIPYIDWKDDAHTMFVPLRNQSLIPLDSPNYPNALFKYYDAAKNCIDASNNAAQDEFDNRFQIWLSSDVVPHLVDEKVYLPLGSVLTLVNTTRALYDRFEKVFFHKLKPSLSHYVFFGVPIDFTSKKTWIIGLLLFLEIAWCIPALIYLAWSRRKKKKDNQLKTLLGACRGRGRKKNSSGVFQGISYKTKNRGFKIETRPRSENLELDSHFFPSESKYSVATDTGSYFGSGHDSAESVKDEIKPPPLKSSMKKISSADTVPILQNVSMKISKSNKTCTSGKKPWNIIKCTPQQSIITNSCSTVPTELGATDMSLEEIKVPSDKRNSKISNTTRTKSSSHLKRQKLPPVHVAGAALSGESAVNCPCLTCLETDVGSAITVVNQESRHQEVCFDKQVEINMEDSKPRPVDKPEKKIRNVGLRLESGRPYLEIKIDKPQAEISVGIGGIFDPLKSGKRSKIPKRLPNQTPVQMASTSPMRKESPGSSSQQRKRKSQIPQPKKRPVDDIDVKPHTSAGKPKDSKLNITL